MFAKKPDRIPAIMTAMTPFPWFIHIEDDLARAREVMTQHGIHHLPVTQEGELVGVVSERDIELLESRSPGVTLSVREACVPDAYVIDVSEPLDRVLLEMARRHVGAALVVKNQKLAGIFTATDACQAFGRFLRVMFPDGSGDEAA